MESKYDRPGSMTQLYLIKGMIYFYKAKYDSSLFCLKKAESLIQSPSSFQLSTTINKYLADNYAQLNDFKSAWIASNKCLIHYDSLLKRRKTFEALLLVTDDYIAQSESEMKSYEARQNILIGIILVVTLSVILILILFFKLQKAHRHLIKKNIELMHAETISAKLKLELLPKTKSHKLQTESLGKINELEILQQTVDSHDEKALDPIKMKNFVAHFEEVMIRQQLFLDPNLSLDNLAHLLKTNRNYLSKVINKTFGVHFSSYINDLRIKKAILIISQKEEVDIYKLEGIAKTVGFTNRTTFISAFRKYTGVTPSFFIKNLSK